MVSFNGLVAYLLAAQFKNAKAKASNLCSLKLFLVALTMAILAFGKGSASPSFPNGLHCGHSPYVYGDILPEGKGPGTWVVQIKQIVDAKGLVFGYVYRMHDNVQLMQAMPSASAPLMKALGLRPLDLKRLAAVLPDHLKIQDCPASLLTKHPNLLPN